MLIKGFALLLLILLPFLFFTAKKHGDGPKILYLTPTPSTSVSMTPPPDTIISPTDSQITLIPTETLTQPTNQPLPTTRSPQQTNSGDFLYPGSSIVSQSDGVVMLTSSDAPTQITNWYKNKISQLGMNTTSFITTNTNDTVNNKLSASNGSKNIQIAITKSPTDALVKISVGVAGI